MVEHLLAKEKVAGSIPVSRSPFSATSPSGKARLCKSCTSGSKSARRLHWRRGPGHVSFTFIKLKSNYRLSILPGGNGVGASPRVRPGAVARTRPYPVSRRFSCKDGDLQIKAIRISTVCASNGAIPPKLLFSNIPI